MDACVILPVEATPYPEVCLDAFRKMKNIVILDADPPEDAIPERLQPYRSIGSCYEKRRKHIRDR